MRVDPKMRGVQIFRRAKILSRHSSLTARIIFSLSALAASLLAGSGMPLSHRSEDSATRLLCPRVFFLGATFALASADHVSPVLNFPHTPQEACALAALTTTPFRRSLWLVASTVAIDLSARRHSRTFLRC